MFIQDQLPDSQLTDDNLSFFKAIGVDYLTINPPPFAATVSGPAGGRWCSPIMTAPMARHWIWPRRA